MWLVPSRDAIGGFWSGDKVSLVAYVLGLRLIWIAGTQRRHMSNGFSFVNREANETRGMPTVFASRSRNADPNVRRNHLMRYAAGPQPANTGVQSGIILTSITPSNPNWEQNRLELRMERLVGFAARGGERTVSSMLLPVEESQRDL